MTFASKNFLIALLAPCAVAVSVHAQSTSGVDFSRRFVPQWADAYLACADGFAGVNFRMAEWHDRPARDVADAADRLCADRLPVAGASPDGTQNFSAQDLAAVRGRVSDWVRGRVENWRAAPTRITTTFLAPLEPRPTGPADVIKLVSCPRPEYPAASVRANAQGQTIIDMDVDAQGHVIDARIAASSGATREHRLLDVAAKSSFANCVFNAVENAPTRHGRVAYTWSLSSDPAPAAGLH